MIKIYIGTILPNIPYTEILYPILGSRERENPFGEKVFEQKGNPTVEMAEFPIAADYLCIPHNYNYVKNNKEYIAEFVALSIKYSKKIIIFFPGDSDEEVLIANSIVFRNSQYRYKKRPNEIIMPAYACDLGKMYGLQYREKGDKPVVGFCGWAIYGTSRQWLSYVVGNVRAFFKPVHKKGLYFRRKALHILSKSKRLTTRFVIRSSYSGNSKTLAIDPKAARIEYVENMKNSDFVLAPKGDGNFSVRFFESLSLGRVPLLVDTDCPLPLEDELDYTEFILKVSYKDMRKLPDIVTNYYVSLTPEQYAEKQKKCREAFEKYLKIESFFAHVLDKAFLEK